MERSVRRQKMFDSQSNKDDEFYTLYEDIDKELINYKDLFRDKTICLPCNDADKNFHKWFMDHKEEYGIKRIIAVHYSDSFSSWYYDNDVKKPLRWNGDFFSLEVQKLIKEADYVVTNPPFSIFSDIITYLTRYKVKYILLGTLLKITGCSRNLLISQQVEFGHTCRTGGMHMEFKSPEGKIKVITNAVWYQNIVHIDVPFLDLTCSYESEAYSKYDDYDAINCNSYLKIPKDYKGLIGVPISFLTHWNPDQFEIVDYIRPTLNGKTMFARVIIRSK